MIHPVLHTSAATAIPEREFQNSEFNNAINQVALRAFACLVITTLIVPEFLPEVFLICVGYSLIHAIFLSCSSVPERPVTHVEVIRPCDCSTERPVFVQQQPLYFQETRGPIITPPIVNPQYFQEARRPIITPPIVNPQQFQAPRRDLVGERGPVFVQQQPQCFPETRRPIITPPRVNPQQSQAPRRDLVGERGPCALQQQPHCPSASRTDPVRSREPSPVRDIPLGRDQVGGRRN